VAHVLAHGVLNRKLSTFGGQQLYAFEGSAAPQEVAGFFGSNEPNDEQPAAALRQLRVLYGMSKNATVVVSAIDLEGE
jgi:hypothetical protein